MRKAGQALAAMFVELFDMVVPGTPTIDIDRTAESAIRRVGAKPAFKGYGDPKHPFPATTCISIDSEIVHGIPSKRKL
ncbi:MAG: M24 family metallopeptidase, partial [Candidatus Electryoneaceae bacterium]|nr:M24 family metallopeptidase [Candidatus Electryoneaceae bacterium]